MTEVPHHCILERDDNVKCRECDLAVYCFSDPSQWVFRTKKDIEQIRSEIESCHIRKHMSKGK